HEGEHAHEHDHGGTDPHFWLDPTRLAKAADAFAAAMAEEDPANASSYEANAAALHEQLDTLDAEFRSGLKTCRTRAIVVSHDAFGYLGSRYDLHVVPIAGLSPDAEPSTKTLAEIRSEAEEEGVTTVFAERLASPALADTLADELGVKIGVLDPLEGLTKDAKGDYLSIMRENLQTLRTANACS
ncbi:MAG: zinc ABC transporter substrate-binding protein, partial [Myxococcales bacterium]